jgi:aminoglycoside phosphotransferase (APT) family kinase protein
MAQSKQDKKFEQLVQKIAPQSKLLRTWALKGGISAQMTALELLLPDGQTKKMIVRRPGERAVQHNPHAAADEFNILQIVQSVGVSAQTPYYLDQSGEIFPDPYLVVEYIEGEPDYAPAIGSNHVVQMATQLAKIHSVDSATLDLSFLPKQAERFAGAFKERPVKLDHSLDEGRIRKVLEAVWPLPQRSETVLLHGDFWPGNVLWKNGQLVAVIDWEDAEVGNPLVDFAISRLDILWIFGVDAMNDFTRHYQSLTNLDFTHLPYWDLYAALRPMSRIAEWADEWPELGRKDITEQTMRDGHKWFITQAFEKLSSPLHAS